MAAIFVDWNENAVSISQRTTDSSHLTTRENAQADRLSAMKCLLSAVKSFFYPTSRTRIVSSRPGLVDTMPIGGEWRGAGEF
jgi:hypothetical protein